MQTRFSTVTAAAACAVAGLAVSATAQTIAEVAPPSSVFVAGADNFAEVEERFNASGFGAILSNPEVSEWLTGLMEDGMAELEGELEALGFSLDDFSSPSGAAGVAVFLDTDAIEPANTSYQFLAMADFGENVGTTHDFVTTSANEAADEGRLTIEEDEYNGATIWTFTPVEMEEEDDGGDDDWDDDWGDDWDDGGGESAFEAFYYTRTGNVIAFSTSIAAVEDTIDAVAGDAPESVAGGEFANSLNQLDQPQAFAVFLTQPWIELTSALSEAGVFERMMGPQAVPVLDILTATGLADVSSFGAGFNFDTNDAAAEVTYSVSFPERRGLMKLVPTADAQFTAPDFVPANAVSVSLGQASLDQLFPVIGEIVGSLPPQLQQQVQGPLFMAQGFAVPIFQQLGPEIYTIQTIEQPYTAESSGTLMAIRAKDQNALKTQIDGLINNFGIPLEQRDFAGNTIYSVPEQMMGGGMGGAFGAMGGETPVIGIGSGYFFVGSPASVENAMRTASSPDAPRLADEPRFRDALSRDRSSGLAYSWSDTEQTLRYTRWMIENQDQVLREQLEAEFAGMPNSEDRIEERMQWSPGTPDWVEDAPDLDIIFEHIGDTIATMRVTPNGIVGRQKILRAND